ncbi:MAG: EAL domain-containing protein [Alphaproteobacteria bacterium]|nr:EAL domain-containing protein [Alphaproteobacteria bacterium]
MIPADSKSSGNDSHALAAAPDSVIFDAVGDALVVTDATRQIVRANRAAARLFGCPAQTLVNSDLARLVPNAAELGDLWQAASVPRNAEVHALSYDGRAFPATLTIGAMPGGGHVVCIRDVTDIAIAQRQLVNRSLRDGLTGLPTRGLFLEQVDHALARRRAGNATGEVAVVCLGIDRFKLVNDSLGYPAGDELLAETAGRMAAELGPGVPIARLGGDEFGILVDGVGRKGEAVVAAERALGIFSNAFAIAERSLLVGASLGIAFAAPEDDLAAQTLLSNADVSMHRAKKAGGGRIEIFEPARHGEALGLLEIELALRDALQRGEFELAYQPILDMQRGSLRGVEALLRWNRENGASVPPSIFIPIAEKSGLIVQIGEWVMRRACAQMKVWRDRYGAAAPEYVAVNLSAKQIDRTDVPALVRRVLADTGLDARHLELELTESTVVENPAVGQSVLQEVVALGVSLAIDDFGTGQSALSLLPRLPLAKLKIDRSFVARMDVESESFEIVRLIVSLAQALGMRTVAEGIERESQIKLLRSLGCAHGQGYFFHRPMPASGIERLCASPTPTPNRSIAAAD